VFGEKWRVAGDYAQILSIMFFCRFISSPLSYVLYIAEKQNYDLVFQLLLLILTSGSIATGAYFNNPKMGVSLFSISYSLVYLFYLILSYNFSKGEILHE